MDAGPIMSVDSTNIVPVSLHLDCWEEIVELYCQMDQFVLGMRSAWTYVPAVDVRAARR